MNNLIAYHDGDFKKLVDISISPLDFGFIHSDATYDVMRIVNGNILFYDDHHKRFKSSCEFYGFQPLLDLKDIAQRLVDLNGITDAFFWVCAYRGTPLSGSPRDINVPQHVFAYVKPYYGISDTKLSLTIFKDMVRDPNYQEYKNFCWREFTASQKYAYSNGYDSALVLDYKGYITEGPGFGVCFIMDNVVYTPANNVLKSVTIKNTERVCNKLGIKFVYDDIHPDILDKFDEVFICSTSGGITPISKIDNFTYKSELTEKIKNEFNSML